MQPNTSETDAHGLSRRAFVGGVAAASIPALAGCTSLTDHEFSAGTVLMDSDVATTLGYEELLHDAITQPVGSSFLRFVDLSITVTSDVAVYIAQLQSEMDRPSMPTVSGFATPKAIVYREPRNPLAGLREPHLLRREEGRWFLELSGVRGHENEWLRSPEMLNSDRTMVFGGIDNRLRTYGGVIEDDGQPTVVFAHMTKLDTETDAVFGLAFSQWDIEDPERDYVGAEGHLTDEAFEVEVANAQTVLDGLRYQ